jgi:hypothetical protein
MRAPSGGVGLGNAARNPLETPFETQGKQGQASAALQFSGAGLRTEDP